MLLRAAERPALADSLLSRHAILGWLALQLGRAQPLETLLGLCLLLARLAAAPGYAALSAALLEPLGPALEALWCALTPTLTLSLSLTPNPTPNPNPNPKPNPNPNLNSNLDPSPTPNQAHSTRHHSLSMPAT